MPDVNLRGGDHVVLVVSRNHVEAQDVSETLDMLRAFVERASNPWQVRGRLALAFHGYDSDPRELWQIPEVRVFMRLLDDTFPYWFYLMDLTTDGLKMVAFCLCRITTPMPGATAINPTDFRVFLERHFGTMNQLLDHWQVPEEENVQASEAVERYFRECSILN